MSPMARQLVKCVISKEATSEAQLGTTAEGMDIVHELDSEGSRRPRDPHTHGGDADSEEDLPALKARLATLRRKYKENLQFQPLVAEKNNAKRAPGDNGNAMRRPATSGPVVERPERPKWRMGSLSDT